MSEPLTPDDLRGIQLDHEAVRMAQGWDVPEREVRKAGDAYALLKLPDDPQRCVDAVPRLLAEVARQQGECRVYRHTVRLLLEENDKLKADAAKLRPAEELHALFGDDSEFNPDNGHGAGDGFGGSDYE